MTEEDRLLLLDLKGNTQRLFQQVKGLEEEKRMLLKQIEDLKSQLNELQDVREELAEENDRLKVANRLLSGKDENRMATKKINFLIREIDKCIALLNK